jgi:HEAT repeat protein
MTNKSVSLRTRRRIQRHIEALNSTDTDVAARAEGYLIRYYGVRAFEPLIAVCAHPNPAVRFRAVWALAYMHDARAYDTILQLTRDPEGSVRYDAAIALGILGDVRAIEPLVTLMRTPDPETAVDSAAAEGLVRLGKPAVPALIAVLQQNAPELRRTAAYALGNIGDEIAFEPLADLLRHPEENTRIAGIEALAAIGTARCLFLIGQCLDDVAEPVRSNATYWYSEVAKQLQSPVQA